MGMKNKIFINLIVASMIFSLPLTAQFNPEELAKREKWEKFLETAEVVAQTQQSGRLAVTNPWTLTLTKDGITRNALWKNPEGRMKGSIEGWKWEIAAYRLDKYLGLNMVPPTVERRFRGDRGSCQVWADYKMNLRTKTNEKIKTPSYKVYYWNRATYLQRAFDSLIANEDRHMGNILITEDWRMILIDHSRSFRSSKKHTKRLVYGLKGIDGKKPMKQLPREFVDRLKSMDFELVKGIVGEYLKEKEIQAMLLRRDIILKEIGILIKERGEDKVLY
jgi:hypothetical protein